LSVASDFCSLQSHVWRWCLQVFLFVTICSVRFSNSGKQWSIKERRQTDLFSNVLLFFGGCLCLIIHLLYQYLFSSIYIRNETLFWVCQKKELHGGRMFCFILFCFLKHASLSGRRPVVLVLIFIADGTIYGLKIQQWR
jgi:hypothetical protein